MVLTHLCCTEISDSPNVCPSGFKNATLLGVIMLPNRPSPNSVVYQTNLYFSFSHIYGSSRDSRADLLRLLSGFGMAPHISSSPWTTDYSGHVDGRSAKGLSREAQDWYPVTLVGVPLNKACHVLSPA